MENIALIDSFSEFKDEKFIDRVTLMVILEEVFRNTLTKKFGTDENFDIIINPDKGDLGEIGLLLKMERWKILMQKLSLKMQ